MLQRKRDKHETQLSINTGQWLCTRTALIIPENSMARLECVVVGIPQPKVLWLKNNRPLKSTDQCRVLSEGNVHILEFPKTKKDDTGLYTARAMNVNGSTISSAELLVGNGMYCNRYVL